MFTKVFIMQVKFRCLDFIDNIFNYVYVMLFILKYVTLFVYIFC